MKSFKTSYGREIPGHIMSHVARRLASGEDWQTVATSELRRFIPEHDEDLEECNEALREAEERAGLAP